MITLLGSLLGFLGASFPDILKFFREKEDRKHEITLAQMQIELQKQGFSQRLEEISMQADIAESKALYKTYTTGIMWVDALNGTVRPVIAYAFFILYAAVKFMSYAALNHYPQGTPFIVIQQTLWSEEDAAIFAGIVSFYFGQRAMTKLRRAA